MLSEILQPKASMWCRKESYLGANDVANFSRYLSNARACRRWEHDSASISVTLPMLSKGWKHSPKAWKGREKLFICVWEIYAWWYVRASVRNVFFHIHDAVLYDDITWMRYCRNIRTASHLHGELTVLKLHVRNVALVLKALRECRWLHHKTCNFRCRHRFLMQEALPQFLQRLSDSSAINLRYTTSGLAQKSR